MILCPILKAAILFREAVELLPHIDNNTKAPKDTCTAVSLYQDTRLYVCYIVQIQGVKDDKTIVQ